MNKEEERKKKGENELKSYISATFKSFLLYTDFNVLLPRYTYMNIYIYYWK